MTKITWGYECAVCHRPINRGKPTILFATDAPTLVGISHSTCSHKRQRYASFQMCPPFRLSPEQISFLIHVHVQFYRLPGAEMPNGDLRVCLVRLLNDYPASLANPIEALGECIEEEKRYAHKWQYDGDLEKDYLNALGQVQKAAKEYPFDGEIDFRS